MLVNFKNAVLLTLSVLAIAIFSANTVHANVFEDPTSSEEQTSTQTEAQTQISDIFNNLETIGGSYNGGGTSAAALAMIDSGCRAALDRAMKTRLFAELKDSLSPDLPLPTVANIFIKNKMQLLGQNSMGQLCAALKGDQIQSPQLSQSMKETIRNEFIPQILSYGQGMAQNSGIPFLSRLEIEMGTSERSLIGSITSIQPLWQDPEDLHHVFAQVSWYKAPDDVSDEGRKVKYNTYNAGIAYRYLTGDKKALYGANMFFDYAPRKDHTRLSLGVDARSSQLAFSANRYMPLSSWRSVDTFNEERAAAGWDAELRGQVPDLPSWTAIVKGYEWDGFSEGDKLYGAQAAVEYSPVPAMAVRVGLRDESEGSASVEAALRFNWRFDQPQDMQFKQRTELAPVSDYVYEKVQRDNIIRVKQRRKGSTKLTVIETTGANSAQEATGTTSLRLGQTLLMPVTVTTANSVGAISRLRFSDGSVLTSGQNTQVLVEPTLITLITGSIQYVNNGTIQTIIVPGGTITLHGTDLDIVSNGTDSSVRVRDGSVTFVGEASGSATLQPEEMAESVVGVVGTLASGTADYVTHTDTVSTTIDRVADPLNGPKVAPYPYEPPRIVSQNLTPGQQIVIGLKFNDTVIVSGGTPRLNITINGNSRTVNLLSGSGTNDLLFSYTVQPTDAGATTLIVTALDKNGASIMGNGKDAVTTIADKTLSLTGSVADVTAPSGYAVVFTSDPINNANKTAASFNITTAEVGTTYNYTISSSGGGTNVTGSGTIAAATESVTGIDVSGLGDGTLTVSVTLTDASANVGGAVTDTVAKDVPGPSGYTVVFTTDPVNLANYTAAAFQFAAAEVGSTYAYTISSSGGGTNVTGSGTIATATDIISGINTTSLNDGTLTVSVTLTDPSANAGTATTDTVIKDILAPTVTSITFTNGTYEP